MNEEQIEKLLEDISSIKSVLRQNRPLVQKIFDPAPLRNLLYAYSLTFIVFPLLFYFSIQYYGGYDLIPEGIRTFLIGVSCFTLFFLAAIKWMNRALLKMAGMIFTGRFGHLIFPNLILAVFLCFILARHGQHYYMVPAFAFCQGIQLNFYGCITGIKRYFLAGYWLLITGVIAIVFTSISPMIHLALTQGIGWILLALPIKEED
ncbi:MAG: hypothetical protein GY729_02875 [Desulfobacteraceae bacterium]|nr:hypothetical protein [Desulfobacteraceae bacterium]